MTQALPNSHAVGSKLATPPSPSQGEVVCVLPSRLAILGEALEPVAKELRHAMTRRTTPSSRDLVVPDDLARHMGIIHQALMHLQPKVDALMSNVVNDENAGMAQAYREAGRLAQVLSEFVDGYHDAKAASTSPDTKVGKDLLLGVYRHHIREIGEWLEEFVQVLADPLSAMQRRGIPIAANVELSVALNMSSPPEMAKLDVKESSQNRRQTLGNKLPAIPQFLLFAESSRLRRFPHFQLAVQYDYPNLNEQMSSLICPTHLLWCTNDASRSINRANVA